MQNRYIQEHFSDTRLVTGKGYISYPVQIAERVGDFDKAWKAAQANLPGDTSEQQNDFRKSIKDVTDIFRHALGFERGFFKKGTESQNAYVTSDSANIQCN